MFSHGRTKLGALIGVAVLLAGASAYAGDGKVTEIPVTVIYGHAAQPVAAVEVSKATARVKPEELKQPLAPRIAEAVHRDPF